MLSFESDYTTGCHKKILEALMKTNSVSQTGYGFDEYCISAKDKIRKEIGRENAEIFFLVGGTQTNKLTISALLHNYEGVISAATGHINAHEAGAIEASGHKVLSLPSHNGKLDAGEVRDYLKTFYADETYTHMVFPGMVYISHPTEYGTLYTKKELTDLKTVCDDYNIPLYLDGARLGYALASKQTDVTYETLCQTCHAFYIGGTKVGALCGEALVFPNGNAPKNLFTTIKQNGALLAKGRLLGVQFDTLFTDGLYNELGNNAIEKAERLKKMLDENGYRFFLKTETNQQFVILENEHLKRLRQKVAFSFWEKYDDTHTVVRFATSWSTPDSDLDALEKILKDQN